MGTARSYRRPFSLPQPLRSPALYALVLATTVLAVLLVACTPSLPSREQSLRECLLVMRKAIAQFHQDTGRYPSDLADLVSRQYLRKLPLDPIAESRRTWVPVAGSRGLSPHAGPEVIDLRSGAHGISSAGTPYSSW